jgi:nuclear factor related to kappa-B-binding protein
LESTVPTGQSDRHWLEGFWKQEIDRYKNPLVAYTFNCIDGSKATVAPAAKKLLSGMSSKPRQHELLKNERPPYVTILSLVRDAAA